MMSSQLKETFERELAKKEEQLNLAYANLLFSEYLTEPFDSATYLSLLDDMADQIWQVVAETATGREAVERLNQHLFEDLKFRGNASDYYNANNSFLHQVLELRTGIPISLSLVYLEIGWRLGLPVWGVGLPGHFIVAYGEPAEPLFIDVFNRGRLLSEDDCMNLARVSSSSRAQFKKRFLRPVGKKAMLYRMLLNLKQIYVKNEDWKPAYNTVDLMLAVAPDQTTELRDRGLIGYRLEQLQQATFDLQRYLFLNPHTPDAAWLKQRLEEMEQELLRLN
jgi:regulator of sirC expression with transglutaminase-like and TPR domain